MLVERGDEEARRRMEGGREGEREEDGGVPGVSTRPTGLGSR